MNTLPLISYKNSLVLCLFVSVLLILGLFLIPFAPAHAAGLVPCDGAVKSSNNFEGGSGPISVPCTFASFLKLVQNVINFLLIIAIPIATAFFAYAGFLVMTSGDNPGQRGRAVQIFKDIGIGVLWILAAWMVVSIIITTIANPKVIPYIPIEKIKP